MTELFKAPSRKELIEGTNQAIIFYGKIRAILDNSIAELKQLETTQGRRFDDERVYEKLLTDLVWKRTSAINNVRHKKKHLEFLKKCTKFND